MLTMATKVMSPTPVVEPIGNASSDDEQVSFGNMGFTPTVRTTSSHSRGTTIPNSRNNGKHSMKKKRRESRYM